MTDLLDLHRYGASNFYKIKDLDNLEEFYYRCNGEIDGGLAEELMRIVYGADREYLSNLVHEGRGYGSTAISSLTNLKWYKEHPGELQKGAFEEARKRMYHFMMLYSIYLQSIIVYYFGVYKRR